MEERLYVPEPYVGENSDISMDLPLLPFFNDSQRGLWKGQASPVLDVAGEVLQSLGGKIANS